MNNQKATSYLLKKQATMIEILNEIKLFKASNVIRFGDDVEFNISRRITPKDKRFKIETKDSIYYVSIWNYEESEKCYITKASRYTDYEERLGYSDIGSIKSIEMHLDAAYDYRLGLIHEVKMAIENNEGLFRDYCLDYDLYEITTEKYYYNVLFLNSSITDSPIGRYIVEKVEKNHLQTIKKYEYNDLRDDILPLIKKLRGETWN